jgi:hypothetical protein
MKTGGIQSAQLGEMRQFDEVTGNLNPLRHAKFVTMTMFE